MTSLYSRLFRYKARPDREPLEDFLSEALSDLLARMNTQDVIGFLNWAFKDSPMVPNWSCLNIEPFEWATQVQVSGGIADIVLFISGKPALVIENKTWSGFQDHSTDNEKATQVTTYCKWLAAAGDESKPCAILLLTGTTDCPDGFHDTGNFSIAMRGQVTWAAFGRWLNVVIQSGDSTATWNALARDLVQFLKEKNLNSEVFTTSDVSAAAIMLPSMKRLRSTFYSIWASADDTCRRFLKPRISDLAFHPDEGMLWQYRYGVTDRTPHKSYVGLALRFPDESDWFPEANLTDHPHFAVMILSDSGPLSTAMKLPDGWFAADDGFVTARGVHTFSAAPDRKVDELQAWGKQVMAQAEEILTSAKLSG